MVRIIEGDDELKKHSRTIPDIQFKKFSLTIQKLDLERTMSELEKPFPIKSDQKSLKKLKINVKMPYVNKKPLARKRNLVQTKTGPRMNYEWIGKTIRSKKSKNSKTQSEIASCV